MNKTVSINIGGFIFHIEEQAYDKLRIYLETIEGYFTTTEGREEIMGDIEARIAEIFNAKVGASKQVIIMADVDEAIEVMGQPEAYIVEDDEAEEAKGNQQGGKRGNKQRRVFRDPDNATIAGVCGGLGAYFNVDPVWFRLAFAVSLVFFGSGFWLYIILWMVLPEAKTTAEKLEMRGENVNVGNIERTIKEELGNLKERFEEMSNEAQEWSKSPKAHKAGNFVQQLALLITQILKTVFHYVGKIIGVFLVLFGLVMIAIFIGSMLGMPTAVKIDHSGISSFSVFDENIMAFLGSPGQFGFGLVGIGLLLGIPLLAMIYAGIKIIFNIRYKNRIIGAALGGIWAIGLVLTIIASIQFGKDFANKANKRETIAINSPANGQALRLELSKSTDKLEELLDDDDEIRWNVAINEDGSTVYNTPDLEIRRSDTDSFYLEVLKTARGATKKSAFNRAENIGYHFEQKDSLLQFDKYFTISKNDGWRKQNLKLTLYVPDNGVVYFTNAMNQIMYNIPNTTNTLDHYMMGRRWKMTVNGLECVDCQGLDDPEKSLDGHIAPPAPPAVPAAPGVPEIPVVPPAPNVSLWENKQPQWIPLDSQLGDVHKYAKSEERFRYEMKVKLNEILFERRNKNKVECS